MKTKIVSLRRLPVEVRKWKSHKKKIVFTNGSFDILHAGHVRYLQKARSFGDLLVVGVNSDQSVKGYKGPKRPINPENDRLEVLAALACVDCVVLFSDPTPIKLIRIVRPDVLAKGADWKIGSIAGAREVLMWGGSVKRIKLLRGRSTTGVIDRILKTASK